MRILPMKKTLNAVSILVLLFAFAGASLSYSADNDWVTLIDGTDGMENFNILGDANWSAQMSAIQATEGSGASFLVTKRDYGDFVVRVEF